MSAFTNPPGSSRQYTDPEGGAPTRDALLAAALRHVPFEGMNGRALAAGARDLAMSPALAGVLIPGGGAGLAAAYHRKGDAALRDSLAAHPPSGRFRDRIAEAVMRRLSLADPELVRAGAATLALPGNIAMGPRLLGDTADVIWAGLGDRAEDVAWWTKRISLGAVLGATILYWLDDRSPGQSDTRDFLERRIDNVMQFEALKTRARRVPGVPALMGAATGWIHAPRRSPPPPRPQ